MKGEVCFKGMSQNPPLYTTPGTPIYTLLICPQGIRQMITSSRSTNGQICACQNSVRHKGVLNGMLFSTNFSSLNRDTSTDFEDIFTDHVT